MPFIPKSEEDYNPILTPLIDMMFLLIIFFLVSTEFIDLTRKVKITLPQSEVSEEAERKIKNVIELSREGRVFFNGKEMTLPELRRALARADPEKPLSLRADRQAPYGDVVALMGICRSLGFQEIDAAVKEPRGGD